MEREPETIMIWVDGVKAETLSGVTVAEALRTLGYGFRDLPETLWWN